MEEECKKKKKISAVSNTEAIDMYLILLSYVEKHQAEISNIIAREI